ERAPGRDVVDLVVDGEGTFTRELAGQCESERGIAAAPVADGVGVREHDVAHHDARVRVVAYATAAGDQLTAAAVRVGSDEPVYGVIGGLRGHGQSRAQQCVRCERLGITEPHHRIAACDEIEERVSDYDGQLERVLDPAPRGTGFELTGGYRECCGQVGACLGGAEREDIVVEGHLRS